MQLSVSTNTGLFDFYHPNVSAVAALPVLYIQQHANVSKVRDWKAVSPVWVGKCTPIHDSTFLFLFPMA